MTRANNLDRFCNISLKDWVLGTIKKVEHGADWNCAWIKTYFELGGESESSGKKSCPMKGAEILYLLGRIKGFGCFKNPGLRYIWDCSRNGAYAILALEYIQRKCNISQSELWSKIQEHIRRELNEEPAKTNQGGPTVAYKLCRLGLIVHNPSSYRRSQ